MIATPLVAIPVEATLGIDPDNLSGTDGEGHLRLHHPLARHWDPAASPDLLMEPAVSPDLGFQQLDLSIFQLRDIGWQPGTSNFRLDIRDQAGEGFNDPQLGPQRLQAMERVVSLFASRLRSPVEIRVDLRFRPSGCDLDGAVRGISLFLFKDFPGAPIAGTGYPGALAEALSGQNLSVEITPFSGDLTIVVNENIDQGCLGPGSRFYYGLDGNVPPGQIGFINLAIHEMVHALTGGVDIRPDGSVANGEIMILTHFIYDKTQGRTWSQMTNAQRRQSQANLGQVVWNGNLVSSQLANFLDPAPALTVSSPAEIAGIYQVGTATFGAQLNTAGLRGELALAVDASAQPARLCQPVANAEEVAGKIAVVDLGACEATAKARNAQAAGALGIIMVSDTGGGPPALTGSAADVGIPAVSLAQNSGQRIKNTLAQALQPGSLSFTASSFRVGEDAGRATITVRRSGGTDGTVSVDFSTTDITATAGEDYLAASGTVSFADGQGGTRSFQIDLIDDEVSEDLEEEVELTLANPTGGAELAEPLTATLVIVNDDLDPGGVLAFATELARGREGEGPVTITVTRSNGTVGAATVAYTTGGGSATADEDYVATSGTLAFADGEGGSKGFVIEILDDDEEESLETIGVALSNSDGAALGSPSSALVEIVDNEACQAGDSRLCLNDGRFRVEVEWRDFADRTGPGQVVPFGSDDSGLFWFFAPDNWEMLIKVLDGCAFNDRFWVFAAATTNVEYRLLVTDTVTGAVQEYINPLGVSSPAITDTDAFASCPASAASPASGETGARPSTSRSQLSPVARTATTVAGTAGCLDDADGLCLNQDRFRVEVEWRDFADRTGSGQVVPFGSDDSGLLWFFAPDNWEMLIKVLDGCSFNDHFWVFAAATTNVEYTLRVTDTATGAVAEYANPLGTSSAAVTDTEAFAACP